MQTSNAEGGLGGSAAPRAARDTRLVERALREHWPIPRALRGPLIERLATIVQDPEASPREATSAARAILAASRLNLETITAAIKAEEHEARDHEMRRRAAGESDGQGRGTQTLRSFLLGPDDGDRGIVIPRHDGRWPEGAPAGHGDEPDASA
jgi:hypothetical protein